MASAVSRESGKSRANKNRAVRQEAMREQIAAQGHEQHVVEMLNKVMDLDLQLDTFELKRYEVALNAKLALMRKYVPDLKATEITGEGGAKLPDSISITLHKAK